MFFLLQEWMNEDRNDEKREGRERWCLVFSSFRTEKGPDKGKKVSNLSCIKWFPVLERTNQKLVLLKLLEACILEHRGIKNLYLTQYKFKREDPPFLSIVLVTFHTVSNLNINLLPFFPFFPSKHFLVKI